MYFAGPSDKNIKFIEKIFNSSIVLRGNKLVVDGNKNEVQKLEQLVHAMINTILRDFFLERKYFRFETFLSFSQDFTFKKFNALKRQKSSIFLRNWGFCKKM